MIRKSTEAEALSPPCLEWKQHVARVSSYALGTPFKMRLLSMIFLSSTNPILGIQQYCIIRKSFLNQYHLTGLTLTDCLHREERRSPWPDVTVVFNHVDSLSENFCRRQKGGLPYNSINEAHAVCTVTKARVTCFR